MRTVTVPGMKKMELFVPQQLSEHCGCSTLTAKKGAHRKRRHVSQNCVVRDPYLYYDSCTRHKSYKFYGAGSKPRKSTLHWPREKLINRRNTDGLSEAHQDYGPPQVSRAHGYLLHCRVHLLKPSGATFRYSLARLRAAPSAALAEQNRCAFMIRGLAVSELKFLLHRSKYWDARSSSQSPGHGPTL